MKIGERLRALRLNRNISQEAVARHIGITRSAYSHYEINNRQPVYETLIKLSAFFDVSLDHIIGGSPPLPSPSQPDLPVTQDTRELLALLQHMSKEQREQSIHLLTNMIQHEQ